MTLCDQKAVDHLRAHGQVYSLLALVVALNVWVVWDMVADWASDSSYSHGFLIVPISIWLFCRRRGELVFPGTRTKWGWAVLVAGGAGMVLGTAANEYFTLRLSLVLMVSGLAQVYLGALNFRKVWFAFFFLLFMIPIPAVIYNSMTLPLQLLASKISISLLQVIGVPSSRSGNIINLPGCSLEVADACSGLRSLVSLLAVAALWGHLSLPKGIKQVVLLVGAVPIAILVNTARVFVVAVGVYAVSTDFAEGFLHELAGMMVFVGALVITLLFGMVLRWIGNPSHPS